MDLYREEVMEHYEHPRNQGELAGGPSTGSGQVLSARDSNASCGDMIQFFIKIGKSKVPNSNNQIIKEVKWKGIGCAITTAAASKLSVYLQGQALKDLRMMSEEELAKKGVGFEVNPGRMKCLMLPVKVVYNLIKL